MMTRLLRLLGALAAGFLSSCEPKRDEAAASAQENDAQTVALGGEERGEFVRRGREAAGALLENLSTQLQAALASGEPTAAVRVCQQVALPLTESTGQQFADLQIRRTSLKVRNPKNAPTADDRAVLERWHGLLEAGKALPEHELQPFEGGARYYQPIMTKALCLKCHGASSALDPALRDLLGELYPADQALEYGEGELRGAIRVDLTSTAPR